MIDMMNLNLKNNSSLLSNLSFDHPLLSNDINDLINILSSNVVIGQIYFKDDIDIESIEKVKLLLEGLPNIDDSKIEKYIIKNISVDEKEQLYNMNFLNIDTWNIAYSIDSNKYSITSLSKYRLINEWFSNIVKELPKDLSELEQVCYLYDKVKMFEFNSQTKYSRLPEILSLGMANSYGYNLVFKELLSLCGISAEIEKYESNSEINFITMAVINDQKYDISGIYLFDPSLDTISKELYKNKFARRLNYNFFAITLDKLNLLKDEIKPIGVLKVLNTKDENEYNYYLNYYKRQNEDTEITLLEDSFKMKINEVHSKVINSDEIDAEIMCCVFENRINYLPCDSEEKRVLKKTVVENYFDRNSELFYKKSVKKMSKNELISA